MLVDYSCPTHLYESRALDLSLEAGSSISEAGSSEGESLFSGASSSSSSQTSISPIDAIDEICKILIDDPILKNVWPLLVDSVPIETAEKHISRLLRRYSHDLRREAKELLERRASRLVRTRAPYLSNRICRHYSSAWEARPAMSQTPCLDGKRGELEVETSEESEVEDVDSSTIAHLEAVRKFLFESPSFESLQDNLGNFVHPETQARKPIDMLLHQRLWIHIQNVVTTWATPRVKDGAKRLQWKCVSLRFLKTTFSMADV